MGFFDRLKKGLSKSRGNLTERVDELVENTAVVDDDFYEELTDILLLSDVGVRASTEIIDELRRRVEEKKVKDARTARQMFKDLLVEEMNIPRPALHWPMGKLALRFQEIGRSVILAAADTFRAAADDQLSVWAERAHVPLIKHQMGSDPAAVVFDAVQAAKARKADLLIIDTAGRLHNKKNLMEELSKMRRIIDREYSEATVRCMLIMDATTGQNGLNQAKMFKDAVEINGIILTKLDGTAKGGVAIAIRRELNVPVWYIGVGEGIDDLQAFEAKAFVNALFGDNEPDK